MARSLAKDSNHTNLAWERREGVDVSEHFVHVEEGGMRGQRVLQDKHDLRLIR